MQVLTYVYTTHSDFDSNLFYTEMNLQKFKKMSQKSS